MSRYVAASLYLATDTEHDSRVGRRRRENAASDRLRYNAGTMRLRTRLLVVSGLFAVAVAALSASTALACSCGSKTPVQAFRDSPVVFVGTLAAIRETVVAKINSPRWTEGDSPWEVNELSILVLTFRIDESLKGPSAGTIEVVTDSSDTSCYAGFEAGRRYLIYTRTWTKVPEPGKDEEAMPAAILERVRSVNSSLPDLATGLCTRSGHLEALQDELDVIRSLVDGRNETRVYGSVHRSEWDFEKGQYATKYAGPMGGVVVTAAGPGGRFETVTDGEGRYRFANLPSGEYSIVPVFPRIYSPSRAIRVEVTPESGGGSAYFSTSTNGRIAGQLFEGGKHVAIEVDLTLFAIGADRRPTGVGLSNVRRPGGAFEFERIPPGRYVIGINRWSWRGTSPYPPTYHPGVADVEQAAVIELAAGQEITVDVSLPARLSELTVTGVVVWTDGTPGTGAYVELIDAAMPGIDTELTAISDAEGRFSIRAFRDRSYSARATANGGQGARSHDVPITSSVPARIVIERPPPAPDRDRER